MKVVRKIIQIDEERCDGCGLCVPSCAEGAIILENGSARVIEDKLCDGLGACIGECPNGALKIIEREADEFDEAAVEEHLAARPVEKEEKNLPCGCPSTQIQSFRPVTPCQAANQPKIMDPQNSALAHWPVKINLIPSNAPFLKGADLLVVADCVPLAYGALHSTLLKGKATMIGCPKFGDTDSYLQKFREIFEVAGIKSITVAYMEVPCCNGLPSLVEKALAAVRKEIPLGKILITTRGQLVKQ